MPSLRVFSFDIFHAMAYGLTVTFPRPITANAFPKASNARCNDETELSQPPLKKQRLENGCGRGRRDIKQCIASQLLPHVRRAVDELGHGRLKVHEIGMEATGLVAKSSWFRTRWDDTGGWLTPENETEVARRAREVVQRLSKLHQPQLLNSLNKPLDSPLVTIKQEPPPTHAILTPPTEPTPITRPKDETKPGVSQPCTPTPLTSFSHLLGQEKLVPAPLPTIKPRKRRLHANVPKETDFRNASQYFQLSQRPYRSASERDAITKGATKAIRAPPGTTVEPLVYHVDFSADEVAQIARLMSTQNVGKVPETLEAIACLCRKRDVPSIVQGKLKGRSIKDLRNFCSDLLAGQAARVEKGLVLSMKQKDRESPSRSLRDSRVASLLLAREMEGNMGFGRTRQLVNFQNEFKKALEDELHLIAEYTNCAGDVTTGSWVSNSTLVCGTTAHSDAHNQQYNKPGNLLLCSVDRGVLRAFPDHRIPRPVVEKGENASEAMRRSQDPWIYSSVVSSDYDKVHKLAFTSSFDRTVKVWRVNDVDGTMEAIATWHHEGNVNFVVVAKDGSGRVATAADVPTEAVRIYTINHDDVEHSPYQSVSCTRTDAEGSGTWAYFPATMQWGIADGTHHLLLVGYSPRSTRYDDADIPEDKRKSGEIMLWDAAKSVRVPVLTASTANVFEVVWHPKLPRFLAATTPSSLKVEPGVRSQVHLFQRDRERLDGAYGEFQVLGCPGLDINEVTLMPNSVRHAYVTAACTNGKIYVWDTAQGDMPIHTLEHGEPLEECHGDREREDTGVKFTAWGSSSDRFYTGSSDGVVKVWNVRNSQNPLVRDILEAPGPVSFGAFSPDRAKLAVGDATGRVFILSIDDRDAVESHFTTLPGTQRRVRRPIPCTPHPDPPPPGGSRDGEDENLDIVTYSRRRYISGNELRYSENPTVGMVRGTNYTATGLFRLDAHLDQDPQLPLLAEYERQQQQNIKLLHGRRHRSRRRLLQLPEQQQGQSMDINQNQVMDLTADDQDLDDEIRELIRSWDGIEENWGFAYEETPVWSDDDIDDDERR